MRSHLSWVGSGVHEHRLVDPRDQLHGSLRHRGDWQHAGRRHDVPHRRLLVAVGRILKLSVHLLSLLLQDVLCVRRDLVLVFQCLVGVGEACFFFKPPRIFNCLENLAFGSSSLRNVLSLVLLFGLAV